MPSMEASHRRATLNAPAAARPSGAAHVHDCDVVGVATHPTVFEPAPANGGRRLDAGRCMKKAIVVTDQAAGSAGMSMVERPEPSAASNDVGVEVHASGFVPTEVAWPATW